ncbi:hypothetical protein [Chitinophaga sp. sic0106]|uniref:hypothetical protein n=1 Tax=Chitinophaga sp. sic0106 TaxID=2854785 RepID=UPI001C45E32A|nr:hypothetical protein [Chitinophaga sp. sic0106]MBV7529088.1 hypothetical protein [Chitinophaga sp. sic0106]
MKFANKNIFAAMLLGMSAFAACTPESDKKSLGPIPAGNFSVTPVANDGNRFVVSNTTTGAFMSVWAASNGGASTKVTDTLTFGRKGTWDINLTAYTQGGAAITKQQVTVAADIPPTQIVGFYDLTKPKADTQWLPLKMGAVGTTITYTPAGVNFSKPANTASNGGIYRKVKINPGRDYYLQVFARGQMVKQAGDSAWFEAYIGKDLPLNNFNYATNLVAGFNTNSACGLVAMNGDVVPVACTGAAAGKASLVKFTDAADFYIVIKAGSNSSANGLGAAGITVDSVKLLEQIR